MLSPPSRRRGLKSLYIFNYKVRKIVASLAEAWIEIHTLTKDTQTFQSPPSRRRGLKYIHKGNDSGGRESPPSRRRGLKSHTGVSSEWMTRRLPRGGVD